MATTLEYTLLLAVCLVVFLSLALAFNAFSGNVSREATAVTASRIATAVSASVYDLSSSGSVSAIRHVDLPATIAGQPYLVYPSPDGRRLIVAVDTGHELVEHGTALLPAEGVRVTGFIAGDPPGHRISYDASSRTVDLA